MKTRIHSGVVVVISLGAALLAAPAIANSLDLTGSTTFGTINNGFFIRTDAASTGTGVIDSFVRLQNDGSEQGYNADARPVMPDVNTSPTFTRDILLSAIPIVVNPSGHAGTYYEFLLDINQTSNNPLLSLDQLQLYTRSTALTSANTLGALTVPSSIPRYNLDGAGDSEILMDYSLNSGSGSGDLFAYIPVSAFSGAGANDYVYLFSQFGAKGGVYATNAGFEEWAVQKVNSPPTLVPEGGVTGALMGLGLLGLVGFRRRFLRR